MRRRQLTLYLARPRTRHECIDTARPCPWVGCKHHTYLTVSRDGQVLVDHEYEPHELEISCALDVIDEHPKGVSHEACADVLGTTVDDIRQIEGQALLALARNKETPRL